MKDMDLTLEKPESKIIESKIQDPYKVYLIVSKIHMNDCLNEIPWEANLSFLGDECAYWWIAGSIDVPDTEKPVKTGIHSFYSMALTSLSKKKNK